MKNLSFHPRTFWAFCALLFLVAGAPDAGAQATANPPGKLTYQGFLTDLNGIPLGNATPINTNVVFRIYTASSGGTLKWAEQQTVTIDKGHFGVLLGEGSQNGSEPFLGNLTTIFGGSDASDRYMEITVGATTIAPRIQFLPAPYALLAANARGVVDSAGNTVISSTGSGANLTALNADNLASGTLPNARLVGTYTGALTLNNSGNSLYGSGANLTALSAANISAGTLADARLSANVALRSGNNTFTGNIGIGTAASGFSLQTVGGIAAKSAGNGYVSLFPGTSSYVGNLDWRQADGTRVATLGGALNTGVDNLGLYLDSGAAFIINNGYVGIGTGSSDPQAPLQVKGYSTRPLTGYYFKSDFSTLGYNSSANQYVSIKSEWYVEAFGFATQSDQRIKSIVSRADSSKDLETISRLKVTDYRMKDHVAAGDKLHKGFIAQEVQAVIPEAVNKGRDFIPDIYAVADTLKYDEYVKALRVSLAKAHGLKPGDKVRLITDDATTEHTVIDVPDAQSFSVDALAKEPKRVFVYGKQVDDFLSVDYNRIFTTGIAAIQQLKKEKDVEIQMLTEKNTALEKRLAELEAKAQAGEGRLASVEKLLKGLSSLKTPATTRSAGEE